METYLGTYVYDNTSLIFFESEKCFTHELQENANIQFILNNVYCLINPFMG